MEGWDRWKVSVSMVNKYEFEYTVKTGFTPELRVVGTWLHLMWCTLVCMLSGPIFWGWLEEEIKTCHEV